MAIRIAHRGPDDSGVWVDERCGYAVAFRRLAIVDLTPEGRQPMHSICGRYVIAFNGEIYNHLALRSELEADYEFRGRSDTEVILAGVRRWGLEETMRRAVGMFAIALWDRAEMTLSLVRDRLGKKPLYYGWQGGVLLFGSELKALRAHERFKGHISRAALAAYLRFSYVPGPRSIYEGIHKLVPGTILTVGPGDRNGVHAEPVPYWEARAIVESPPSGPFNGSEEEALDQLDTILGDATQLRMVADVPVGAFLSGGIDSSLVVAQMQRASTRPVRTFSIGFHERGYDEAVYAKLVAAHLRTDHTELYVRAGEAMDVIPLLPALYDEPFSDSSQIPTYLVSKLARSQVTVALSGDGGDELFGGYHRYFRATRILSWLQRVPVVVRRAAAAALTALPPHTLDRMIAPIDVLLPARGRGLVSGDRIHKLAGMLEASDLAEVYRSLVSHWSPETIMRRGEEPDSVIWNAARWPKLDAPALVMMYLDLVTYLVDDILVKVDRASMGVSLEVRAPLLDHRVVEFAWSLPLEFKIHGHQGKYLLRRLLDRYVPRTLIERPKQGFGIPMRDWLRGPLRPWAEELLDVRQLEGDGFFDPAPIRERWSEHLEGRRNWGPHLWNILVFQQWLGATRRSAMTEAIRDEPAFPAERGSRSD